MLIAVAGLPATGKSTIARELAVRLGAVLLDKDKVRAALFKPEDIEYTTKQNDFCMDIVFQVAEYLIKKEPLRNIIIDGRPFSKRYQVDRLVAFATRIATPLKIIECTVSDEDAKKRLENDRSRGNHLAANRNFDLFLHVKLQADAIEEPKLVINTSELALTASVEKAVDYILAR
jgi:predicted kinase